MNKIMVFHNQYDTKNSPRTLRWTPIIEGLQQANLDVSVISEAGFNPPKTFIKRLINAVFRWPDNHYKWLVKMALKIFRKEMQSCNLVVGVSHPFSSLILAYLYSKIYSSTLVLDLGDPFAGLIKHINNNFLYYPLNYLVERKILHEADLIFVTNKNFKNFLLQRFNLSNNKIIVAYPIAND